MSDEPLAPVAARSPDEADEPEDRAGSVEVSDTPDEVPDADPQFPDVPEAPAAEPPPFGSTWARVKRVLKSVFPLVVAGGLIAAFASLSSKLPALGRVLRHSHPPLFLAAIGCEVASYLMLGLHLRLLGGPRENVRRLAPWRIAWVLFGLGNVLPAAPAEGLVMVNAALRRRRLARRRAQVVLGTSQLSSVAGLYVLVAVNALVVVAVADDAPVPHSWALTAGGLTGIVVLVAMAYLLTRQRVAEWACLTASRIRFWRPREAPADSRDRGAAWHVAVMRALGSRGHASLVVLSVVAAWTLDGLCFALGLAALGHHLSLDVLLLAYSVGTAASMVPLLPAGLGIVETLTPWLLTVYGNPFATALGAVLVYRVIATLLPALVGVVTLITLKVQDAPDEPEGDSSCSVAIARP